MTPQAGLSLPGASWDGQYVTWSGQISDSDLENAALPPRDRAEGLYELLERLPGVPEERKSRVVKGQLVGPITLARWSRDVNGASPLEHLETLQRLGAWLGAAAAEQARVFQRQGFQAIIMFDEPELASVGEPAIPLPWREVIPVLRAAIEPLQRLGALAGIQCCAAPNWTRVLDARPNLIHFDAREGHVDDGDRASPRRARARRPRRLSRLGVCGPPTVAGRFPSTPRTCSTSSPQGARSVLRRRIGGADLQALDAHRGLRRSGTGRKHGAPGRPRSRGTVDGHPAPLLDRRDYRCRSRRAADLRRCG